MGQVNRFVSGVQIKQMTNKDYANFLVSVCAWLFVVILAVVSIFFEFAMLEPPFDNIFKLDISMHTPLPHSLESEPFINSESIKSRIVRIIEIALCFSAFRPTVRDPFPVPLDPSSYRSRSKSFAPRLHWFLTSLLPTHIAVDFIPTSSQQSDMLTTPLRSSSSCATSIFFLVLLVVGWFLVSQSHTVLCFIHAT